MSQGGFFLESKNAKQECIVSVKRRDEGSLETSVEEEFS